MRDSVKIYFRQGYSILDLSIRDNRQVLERIADSLSIGYADSVYTLKKVMVVGGASPEGTIPLNKRLSEKRANVLFDYLAQYGELPDSLTSFVYLGRDWNGLADLVEADPDVPYRDETLEYLRDIAARSEGGEKLADNNVGRLSRFKGGEPYRYMYRELFPEIRASRLYLWYEKERNPIYVPVVEAPVYLLDKPESVLTRTFVPPVLEKPFYMALKTNMLYDALLVPNASDDTGLQITPNAVATDREIHLRPGTDPEAILWNAPCASGTIHVTSRRTTAVWTSARHIERAGDLQEGKVEIQ